MNEQFTKNFLVDSENTGRFIVTSLITNKRYYVEAIGDPHTSWGSVDPASNKMTTKKGWKRNRGSIDACNSMIEEGVGFDKIHNLKAGVSPLAYIEELDSKYRN